MRKREKRTNCTGSEKPLTTPHINQGKEPLFGTGTVKLLQ
jgi:hypothetical protein